MNTTIKNVTREAEQLRRRLSAAPAADDRRLTDQQFREIVETVSEVFWSVEPALRRINYVSPGYERIWGRSCASLYANPRSFIEGIHPTDRDRFLATLRDKDSADPFEIEYRVVRPDGSLRWVWDRGFPVCNAGDGRLTHFVGVAVNITEQKRVEGALRESEQQMRLFLETTADSVWNWDLVTGDVERSIGFSKVFGYSSSEIEANACWWEGRLHPVDRARVMAAFESAVTNGANGCSYEYRFRRRDGAYAVVQDRLHIVRDGSGKALRALGVITDITQRRHAEAALHASEERFRTVYRKIVSLSSDMLSFAPERIDTGINGALAEIGAFAGVDRCRVFLFDEAQAHVSNTHEWCAPGIEPAIARLQNLPVDDYPWVIPQMLRGEVAHVPRVSALPLAARAERAEWEREAIQSILLVPMNTSSGVAGYVGFNSVRAEKRWPHELIVMLRYFGEMVFTAHSRKLAATALRENRQLASTGHRLRSLSRRLVQVRDEEQRRLSRELHDGIGQNLAALSVDLGIIRSLTPPGLQVRLDAVLQEAQGLLESSASFMRNVISELRPPALEEYGLLAGLRWYGAQVQARTGMTTVVEGEEPMPRLPGTVEWELFRIAQEALTNTVKHAQARNASVQLSDNADRTLLVVADDGIGFDPLAAGQAGPRAHWGLLMMQDRAEAVGAELRIEAAPGRGTRVVVEVQRTT